MAVRNPYSFDDSGTPTSSAPTVGAQPYQASSVAPGGTPTIPPTAVAQPNPSTMNAPPMTTTTTSTPPGQPTPNGLPGQTGPVTTTGTSPSAYAAEFDPSWNPSIQAQGLHQAISMGLSGQQAVDYANQNYGGGYQFYPDKNAYGIPGGQGYIYQNGQGAYAYAPGDAGGATPGMDTTAIASDPTMFDPNGAQTDSALSTLISEGGTTPFGGQVQSALAGIIGQGGVAPDTTQQLVAARDAEAQAEQDQLKTTRDQLASQGVAFEPGVESGAANEGVQGVERAIAPSYSTAISGIEENAATLKEQSLTSALQTATGMSEANATAMLSAIGTGTQRTTALSNIALSVLATNEDWNKFLATNGLSQAQLEAEIQNNNNSYVIGLINAYVAGGGVLNQGFI